MNIVCSKLKSRDDLRESFNHIRIYNLCNILSKFIMILYSGLDSSYDSGCVVGRLLHFVMDYL